MHIDLQIRSDVVVGVVTGRIDHISAEGFRESLVELFDKDFGSPKPVVLNFAAIDFVSSAGIHSLLTAARAAKNKGRKFAIAAAKPLVQEIFTISRLSLILPLYLSIEAASVALNTAT